MVGVCCCFVWFFKFGARHFCFLKSQLLLSWGKRLSEDLATFSKPFPLDRKQPPHKSPNNDRFLDSKSAETPQECSGEVLQVLASCKLDYFPDSFVGDLMQKQNLSCCLRCLMAPSHQPCWAGWADCAKRVWKYEAMEVSCAREVDVFCLSAQAPCAKIISPCATASRVLSEIQGPSLHVLAALSQFPWALCRWLAGKKADTDNGMLGVFPLFWSPFSFLQCLAGSFVSITYSVSVNVAC